MRTVTGALAAPFPYFWGKSLACKQVWAAFGDVKNYVEPFCGSAAMLLGAPEGKRVETINDFDGFVSNFWRAIAYDPEIVAHYADWPVNENDLLARHIWLVRQRKELTDKLHADPMYYDPKVAGWWCWGACNWIGRGWCAGDGPWVKHGDRIVNKKDLGVADDGVNRQIPNLSMKNGVNRKLPSLDGQGRRAFIHDWFYALHERMREVRVACGDWRRVLSTSVTTFHGLTAVFLDPPYTNGDMDYGAGGMGQGIADDVRAWCAANGDNPHLRIVLCGHAGEHDELIAHGWHTRTWKARKGYALSKEAKANTTSETLWCSPHCVKGEGTGAGLFA